MPFVLAQTGGIMNASELKYLLPRHARQRLRNTQRWLQSRPARTRQQQDALLASPTLDQYESDLLRRVPSAISYQDQMYRGDGEHYFKVGLSAIDNINNALQAAELTEVSDVLDLPCGYGRVLRFLVQRFPDARVHAGELMPDALRFCAEYFGAVPLQSAYDLTELNFEKQFDLIWCGSLITHLEEQRARDLIGCFARHLKIGGLVVFTTHGDHVAAQVSKQPDFYGLRRAEIPGLVKSYQQVGFGYLEYPGWDGYGVSLTSPDWIRAQAAAEGGLREVYFAAQGWDRTSDVFGFVKEA